MKRRQLIRHLEEKGCVFIREGGNHTIYKNPRSSKLSAIPRHWEIKEFLVKKICDDLDIKRP